MDQQSLLRWGIENAAPNSLLPLSEDIKAGRRPDLNTDVLRQIMGKTDADRMLECVQVIEGHPIAQKEGEPITPTKEDRMTAWIDLEMLIEDIDNANNLKFMKLWEPIIKHLSDEDEDFVTQACWVCGTAVQNNPKAQEAFLEFKPLPTLLPIITSTSVSAATRSKAMYCLSATLKHFDPAVDQFEELDGWSTINQALQDSSQILRSKSAFFLAQLVLQSPSPSTLLPTFRTSHLFSTLLASLSSSSAIPTGPNGDVQAIDVDYKEKALRVFVNLVERAGGDLEAAEKASLRELADRLESEADWDLEQVGLADTEWSSFKHSIAA